jgi:hypothetical protein
VIPFLLEFSGDGPESRGSPFDGERPIVAQAPDALFWLTTSFVGKDGLVKGVHCGDCADAAGNHRGFLAPATVTGAFVDVARERGGRPRPRVTRSCINP